MQKKREEKERIKKDVVESGFADKIIKAVRKKADERPKINQIPF